MSIRLRNHKKSGVNVSPIPELICTKKPSKGNNDGEYLVKIPFKYMLVTETAASYAYKFIGIKYAE